MTDKTKSPDIAFEGTFNGTGEECLEWLDNMAKIENKLQPKSPIKMTIELKCRHSDHVRKTGVESTEYYCMNCGKQSVWEDDCDDYYQGTGLHCVSCNSTWQNCSGVRESEEAPEIRRRIELGGKE